MFKKPLTLLIVLIGLSNYSYSQYGDDLTESTSSDSVNEEDREPFLSRDKLQPGAEFMFTANSGAIYGELSPFLAFKPKQFIMGGVGFHGSFLNSVQGTNTYYGAHAFARLTIAQQFFLNYEYRLLNGIIPNSTVRRGWVASPIYSIGLVYGPSYVMFGFANDPDFQNINPLGSFVYRLGLYF